MAFEQINVGKIPRGQAGQLTWINKQHDEDTLKVAGLSAQSVEIEVTTAANTTLFEVTEATTGEKAGYTSDASGTKIEIAAGLAAAWNANPMLLSLGLAVSDGVDTVTINMKSTADGISIASVSSTGAGVLTVTDTPAAVGSVIPFGALIFKDANGYATTTRPAGTIANELLGISILSYEYERANTNDAPGYPPGYDCRILRTGGILVTSGDNAAYNDPVYVGVAADGEAGQLFNAAAGSRELQSKQLMRWVGPNSIEIFLGR